MSSIDRESDIQAFREFVRSSPWRFAKTYVESYPHEYTLEDSSQADNFWRAILCIERWGIDESFWNARRKYLHVDERKYWHMGDASSDDLEERPGLINRSWLDVSKYREEAKGLGYADTALDRLVVRWKILLQKAARS